MFPNKELLQGVKERIFTEGTGEEEIVEQLVKVFEEQGFEKFDREGLRVHRGIKEVAEYFMSRS